MASNQKVIYVYESFRSTTPNFLGTLFVENVRGRESYSFEYDADWLKSSANYMYLDPDLQLYAGRQYPTGAKNVFGLFADSSPDRWGRLLMTRRERMLAEQEGRKPRKLLDSDFLMGVYDETRMGAIRFKLDKDGPFLSDDSETPTPPWTSLRTLEEASRQFENDESGLEQKWINLFTTKDTRFKEEPFLREIKEVYTELIHRHISDPEQHLKVFDKNSVYLPTKKIGKNNPKADEIKADNAARQEWNRTADMALLSGISEAKILEVKRTEIHEKTSQSIKTKGWLPGLFRSIVSKAKDFLQNLIREHDMPPKPVLEIDMAEFRTMQKLMIKAQDKAKEIRHLQDTVLLKLKQQLADTKGIFKGKERKALTEQIQRTEKEIAEKLDKLPDVLKEDGYPDVQAFMATYRKAEAVVEQYNRDLAAWEREVRENRRPAEKERLTPPEKKSIRDQLRRLQAEGRQRSQPKRKSHDRER